MEYKDFLASKRLKVEPSGFDVAASDIHPALCQEGFEFQRDIVIWGLKKGRCADFTGTGTGKTIMQLEWARHVCKHTGGNILILTPLAVAEQTVREAKDKLDLTIHLCRTQADVLHGINITNYEMLSHFDAGAFVGVVLDESSILKSFGGATKIELIKKFKDTKYKLACTATPSPNDHIEITNHSEFLGVMKGSEVLATFFTHGSEGIGDWTIKPHARKAFYDWLASWAVMFKSPADIGYDGSKFELPELKLHEIVVDKSGYVVREAQTLQERRGARRDTIGSRVECAKNIVCADDDSSDKVVIWCNLNDEQSALKETFGELCVSIDGQTSNDEKVRLEELWRLGDVPVLITKPMIFSWGMNWQHCHKMIFVGLSDSFEQYYQAVRRCWRFGQMAPVDVWIITSELEGAVVKNIKQKERKFEEMLSGMIAATQEITKKEIHHEVEKIEYKETTEKSELWEISNGDNIELNKRVSPDSIHYILFSPPFKQLFVYSDSSRDIGNCKSKEEFETHMRYLSKELYRVLIPGRLMSVHCTQIPISKGRDGYIGMEDFRGDLIRLFQADGFILHSEVVVWKDPVQEMYRTKSLGLLHKQLRKDSAMSRQGRADYILTFQKRGDNPEPITHTNENFPVPMWQRYASPVWMDINQMDVLTGIRGACDEEDEKHICPLQLEVIRRCLELWTNPGDVVLDPFAGIGSTGYEAVKSGRQALLYELKQTYYEQAVRNLKLAERELAKPKQRELFEVLDEPQT